MIAVNTAELVVTVRLTNANVLADNSTAGTGHVSMLLIGDDDNNIVYKAKVRSRHSGCSCCCYLYLYFPGQLSLASLRGR